MRVLLTVGRQTDVNAIGPPAANAHIEAWVPQAEILSTAAVVVAHGGSGTTFGAAAAQLAVTARAKVPTADELNNRLESISSCASETDPSNDCDPGNSGGHNNGGD